LNHFPLKSNLILYSWLKHCTWWKC